ncbi:wall-associated protein, partial [Paenibacillus dendritiformis]|uniref:contractile injection system protein, VgrG/Pvc8 family n=1 Tax=Paenibacillus dendritiformis TaxID=130049 RepID=UPI00169B3314|nr:wall-associated protein [Paenibacillus dendritiformis]
MSRSTKLAGYGNIQIVSSYEIHTLSTLRIEKKVNEHARMLLTAIIPEEKKDSCVDMANDTDTIEIRELSDEGDVIRTLFHGVLSDIAVKVVRGVYHLEMEAVSHSYRLDLKPKTRSFQNHKMPYKELVQHILSDYPGSDFIDLTFENAPLDQFTVQYEETDWQFLKRMVSRFGTALIPEAAANSPKLWVGLPEGKPDSLRNTNYQVLRSHNNYGQKEDGVTSYL